ncbi:MAG TPA: DUF192 domain-containing protein [Phycisphaerales bacterium]|nr:DUF192 domain-containing protein [Phycisphaerales bacterium]
MVDRLNQAGRVGAFTAVAALTPVLAACDQAPGDKPAPTAQPVARAQQQPDPKQPPTQPSGVKPAEPKQPHAEQPEATPTAEGDPWPPPANPPLPTTPIKLGDRTFKLEMALNDDTRFKGLSGRREIASDGGMIFVFKRPQPLNFVMRDCPIPIDIIYVDATGRITAMHHMKPEPPRAADEKEIDPRYNSNVKYENRLKQYPSRYDAVLAIELKADTLNIEGSNPGGLELKVGQKLDVDISALKKQAK